MSSSSPLFSIVMPTRNRAHLLPHALRSALEQEFDDYEIVVVANDCHDRTREIVSEMRNDKVRYYETHRLLTMPDNYDFAWTRPVGKYVTYLPDDDALTPSTLRLLAEQALDGDPPLVSWEDAPYYYPDWHDPLMRNLLLISYPGDTLVEKRPERAVSATVRPIRVRVELAAPEDLQLRRRSCCPRSLARQARSDLLPGRARLRFRLDRHARLPGYPRRPPAVQRARGSRTTALARTLASARPGASFSTSSAATTSSRARQLTCPQRSTSWQQHSLRVSSALQDAGRRSGADRPDPLLDRGCQAASRPRVPGSAPRSGPLLSWAARRRRVGLI